MASPSVPTPGSPERSALFATSTTHRTAGRLRRVAAAAIAVVVIGGGVAVATRGSSTPSGYRVAVVGTHQVDQVLDGVATIEPVSQATVAFPVAGTVSGLRVRVGDTVSTGQSLATLDVEDLKDTLDTKQAALDQANLILAKALDGEDVSALVRSSGSGSSGGSGGSGSAPSGASNLSSGGTTADLTSSALSSLSGVGGLVSSSSSSTKAAKAPTTTTTAVRPTTTATGPTAAQLKAAAQAVADAQKQVDADLAAAQEALEQANQVCDAVVSTPPTTTTTTTLPTDGSMTTTAATTQADVAADDDAIDACTTALKTVLTAQQAVSASEQALTEASTAYATLLSKVPATGTDGGGSGGNGSGTGGGLTTGAGSGSGSSSSRTGTGSGSGTGSASTSGAGTGSGGTGQASGTSTSTAPSADDLVSYQKSVDAAAAAVAVAQQAIAQATIVSPIDGTVAAVDLAIGDDVTAASTSQDIVIVGKGGYEVTTSVSVAKLPKVEVGQAATVVPDGSSKAIAGKVVAIGLVGTTGTTTTTYPVTIGLTGDTSGLGNGATASVEITTDQSDAARAVPTSAVTTTGTRHTVTVLADGKTSQVSVQVGAVGRVWTEITSGLDDGQRVVLADLSEPLPGSATASTNGTNGTGNRTGGFTFPGGGTGGPPAGFGTRGGN